MICDGVSSGVALIFVGDDGENMIGVASGANLKLVPGDDRPLARFGFRAGDVLMVGLEIPIETAAQAIERGSRAGMRVILNPAPYRHRRNRSRATCSRWSMFSRQTGSRRWRWRAWTRTPTQSRTGTSCADRLLRPGARAVVITLGAEGCLVATSD